MIQRIQTLFLFLFCVWIVSFAQLSVKSFTMLENDMDARVTAPVIDQNGQKCALIKVVTTETGFSFDVGLLGVQQVVQKPSEIWVYVPERTAKIKIMHPQLGQLDLEDGYYWFSTGRLKAATCYRLELIAGRVTTLVEEREIPTGYLVITSEPDGADVYITENGNEAYAGVTPFQKKMPYGKYSFRVEKSLYHAEVGIAEINSARLVMPVQLRPQFGALQLSSVPNGAKVLVEGITKEYTTPCTISNLPSGKHKVRLLMDQYSPVIKYVTIQDNQTTTLEVPLASNCATVTIQTLPNADVYINGKHVATGTHNAVLPEGIHDVEVRLESHEAARTQVQVSVNQSLTIELNPRPIYGTLDVMTIPVDAHVLLNGKDAGVTPLTINQLLIGEYTLTISKSGYATRTQKVIISKGRATAVEEKLEAGTATAQPVQMPVKQTVVPVASQESVEGVFTVSASTKVHFAKGNLQYRPSTKTWQFAENQWDYIGEDNEDMHNGYDGWIDLFAWGTGKAPTKLNERDKSYAAFVDWCANPIMNAGNEFNQWRTLSESEWSYLFERRKNANQKWGVACVAEVNGIILLPDNWTLPSGCRFQPGKAVARGREYFATVNNYTEEQWRRMEQAGAVFLPTAGYRHGLSVRNMDYLGYYWTSTPEDAEHAYHLCFGSDFVYRNTFFRSNGLSVRAVKNL